MKKPQPTTIPTIVIKKDLKNTLQEIQDLEDANIVLNRNPIVNRMQIYNNEGRIQARQEFIKKLGNLLKSKEI